MDLVKIKKVLITILLTFLCIHIFIIDIDLITLEDSNANLFFRFFQGLFLSMKPIDFRGVIVFVLFYYFLYGAYFEINKKSNFCILASSIFSLITIIGLCYDNSDGSMEFLFCSFLQIYKFLILFFAYYIIYYAIFIKFTTVDISKLRMKETFLEKNFQRHPILLTALSLSILFLSLAVFFYPGGSTGDTADSVFQFFHSNESWSIQSINLIDEDVYINKHHSVLFTIMLGSFLKFGNYIYSHNLGFFMFILFQLFVLISVFTFLLYYMKKIKMPFYLILFSFLFICLNPLIIKYSLTAIKDTLNALFTVIYVVFLFQIVRNYASVFKHKFRLFIFIVVMLLVMLLRNNGVFTIIFSFPFLFFVYKEKWKKMLKVFVGVLIMFGMYDSFLLPSLGVSDGSIKEVLSIPFMQLARVAKYHKDDFSTDEINRINEVLDFNNIINNYNPKISDEVKETYKKTATREELFDLFGIWFKYLKKYPLVYIDSFLNSTYGYFYPPYNGDDPKILFNSFFAYDIDLNLSPLTEFNTIRAVVNYVLCYVYYSPFSYYFSSVAIFDFSLVFSFIYIFRKKKYKYLVPLFPLMSVLLVCLASPVNGCARYILPIIFSFPMVISIDYFVYRECNLEKFN